MVDEMISIIVPVYNREHTISKCVNSILNQTYRNFELILIDDGSTDESGDLCDDFSKQDSRVKVFHQENKGVSAARNQGLKLSGGVHCLRRF